MFLQGDFFCIGHVNMMYQANIYTVKGVYMMILNSVQQIFFAINLEESNKT